MMKSLYFIFFAFIAVNARSTNHLLGAKECTWGPSYWCSNLTAAAGCHAVKHCIQNVWQHKRYPEDTDTVCQTCLSMVKQARDQLQSNETQEEIKEVFEGSCKLIPIKIVNQECCKLADNFIPELVDTLASQMNPQVVCSVAGLCNNVNIDKLLADQYDKVVTPKTELQDTCGGCHRVIDIVDHKFRTMTRDDFLQGLLHLCGRLSSFSDSCSNIILTYFTDIYTHMTQNFNSESICMLSGECSTNFHVHKVEITPRSKTGVVPINDNLPCDLCVQLVGHLRDLLIADTTELEFQKVLQGLCKQTSSFKDQCLSIVNEYYPVIYKFLVDELNSTAVCTEIQICPNTGCKIEYLSAPITPLLPVETLQNIALARVGIPKPSTIKILNTGKLFEQQNPVQMQLPIERIKDPRISYVYNRQACAFCEYLLHYLQDAITSPRTERSIKEAIDKACYVLPSSINETCVQFVRTYGDAFVAILAQEIDPSTICPLLQVCPQQRPQDIEVFMQVKPDDKPNCPLCLFAVTRLEQMIKEDRTRTNIKRCLSTLCSHLSGNLAAECNDFVFSYTDELVEMLADDFKPQEVCVYLKICTDNTPAPQITYLSPGGLISTNEIPDFTANGKVVREVDGGKPQCVLCEFAMEKLETMLKDRQTEDEIKTAIHSICDHMPKSVSKECNDFVSQYADLVFDLLVASVKPEEICQEINLCDKPKPIKLVVPENVGSPQCVLCKMVMSQIEQMLPVNVSEDDIKTAVKTVCSILPQSAEDSCDVFIDQHGEMIYKLLVEATSPGEVCSLLFLCGNQQHSVDAVKFQINKCSVCETTVLAVDKILQNPMVDHSIEHVLEKACRALPVKNQQTCKQLIEKYGQTIFNLVEHMADTHMVCKELDMCSNVAFRPKREILLGASKCSWGPSYWCEKESQARNCGDGVVMFASMMAYDGIGIDLAKLTNLPGIKCSSSHVSVYRYK